jgi:8-oxo-dGTP diphosphatase
MFSVVAESDGLPIRIAIAVLEQQQRWLLQLRDDDPAIVAPGCWGLFGGHLESDEGPEEGLRRELHEEIGHVPDLLIPWFTRSDPERTRHVFRGPLLVPLADLRLQEGQDMVLVDPGSLLSGMVWSPRLRQHRRLAPSLVDALFHHRHGSDTRMT